MCGAAAGASDAPAGARLTRDRATAATAADRKNVTAATVTVVRYAVTALTSPTTVTAHRVEDQDIRRFQSHGNRAAPELRPRTPPPRLNPVPQLPNLGP
ncbi:hypothetical protein Acy02nite_07140 [Actinoplanes cyaneus]|uniref:Uncharacterized protein n=1 Tax=Actinoplanes cyaneus TaxID=52696 RepID=A0A919IG47_9ACTN|nr:hypothetical protein Acy02nite_07140 [Actinoplanes cyaneus]